jgi:hypothetical protein
MIDNFWAGFLIGATTCFLVLAFLAYCSVEKPYYQYQDIGDMTCVKINGEFVSCNWDEWIR